MAAEDPNEVGGNSTGGDRKQLDGQQQQPQQHHEQQQQQQPPPRRNEPQLPPLQPAPMIRRSSSANEWSRRLSPLVSPSSKRPLTPRTDGYLRALRGGWGQGAAALGARRAAARKRSRTMGDQELWKATRAGGGGTPTHAGGHPGGALSHSDTFRLTLESKWREARAARERERALERALERSQHGPAAGAIAAPAGSGSGKEEHMHRHQSGGERHMHRHHSSGGYRPGPVARFAAVAVDLDDALRPPSVAKNDSLAILVDEFVPEAAAAAPLEAAEELCLPGTRGHAAMLLAACSCAFGAAFGKAVISAVSTPLMADMGMSKQSYGTLAGLPAITSLLSGPLGGLLVDRWGPDKGCVAFATCVAVGGALAAAALPLESVACLALSQIVMGVGKGTLTTAQKVFLRLACAPGEASFFFALSFSLTHLGTFLAFILAPLVEAASPLDYKAGVYTSAGITLACLLLTLPLLGRLDHILPFLLRHDGDVDSSAGNSVCSESELLRRGESEASLASVPGPAGWEEDPLLPEQRPRPDTASTATESTASSTATPGGAAEEREGHAFPLSRSASTPEEEEAAAAAAPVAAPEAPVRPDAAVVEEAAAPARRWWACGGWGEAGGMFHPADLCTAAFGLLLLSNLMFYAFFAPLEAFAVPALTSMAGFSDRKASLGASILPALSIILSPPFGAVVDRELGKGVGGRRHRSTNPSCLQRLWPPGSTQLWAMLLPALGIGAIIVHPSLWALGFGLISLGYALSCASLWIVIPEFVATRSLGLSFGLIHAVDDAGILAVQVAIGRMLDQGRTYRGSILPLLLTFALLGAAATLALMRLLRRKLDDDAARRAAAAAAADDGLGLEMVGAGQEQQGQQGQGQGPVVVAVEVN